jgi:hypothetical protein
VTSCTTPWSTLNAPARDKFQIITAHDGDTLRTDPTYLGIDRSAAAFTINITSTPGALSS